MRCSSAGGIVDLRREVSAQLAGVTSMPIASPASKWHDFSAFLPLFAMTVIV